MLVPVVNLREVRVRVPKRFMPVAVSMFAAGCHRMVVLMLVMLVVNVLMVVLYLFVGVSMLMALGQMQPDTQRHQCTSHEQLQRDWLTH